MNRVLIFGATSAIAQETARSLAGEGARFFLVARNERTLADVAADLEVRGAAEVTVRVADLAELGALDELCDAAQAALGGIDMALIAQGVLPDQQACEASAAETLDALRVNTAGPAALMIRIGNILSLQGSGTLVVVSSVAGDRGRPSNYIYGASKALLSVMGEGMALALAGKGVKVLVVKPGFVDTPMTAAFPKGALWASAQSVGKDIAAAVKKGRRGVIYVPFWWRFVMLVVRFAPGFLVRRL
ncbi:SDR family NAD(P)-dependent oxidoreductase [Parvibaculum sp.]|uniref:SDR family NAD(P)-dependent oxidoreductase n=1 Tax=Parvibaculum sp. TaxID=2024848 RepID=UPI002C58D213|nr:SDR family NAD(P)-dependent oxidoreductase [Parvibaculum sp.]HUD51419.1 SDR family NAD(P)-dependent oxidoreductase [Parvibaculum sp.]